MRPTTVVLASVSPAADVAAVAACVGSAANVAAVLVRDGDRDDSAGWQTVWSEIERVHATYAVTDADPLETLGRAYVAAWQSRHLERFDIAAVGVSANAPRPDFYLILDDGTPEQKLDSERALRREWYFGLLARAAPARVLVAEAGSAPEVTCDAVKRTLARLPCGAEIPRVPELAELARKRIPGQLL